MDEAEVSRYWCHVCSQRVSPIMEVDSAKCPICHGGFVEEMASAAAAANAAATTTPGNDGDSVDLGASDSDRAASLWAPILLSMLSNPRRFRRFRSLGFEEEDEENVSNGDNNEGVHNHHQHHRRGLGMALDQELAPGLDINRRRANNVLQLLHGIRAAMPSGPEDSEDDQRGQRERDSGRREGGRVILINPFNQTIVIQGSFGPNGISQNVPMGSLGDYFVGPGLESFLQHLAENDPNRYGTAPAMKDAVEALPDVKVEGELQCSVCLEEFENGDEAKQLPCNHKFHSGCILPWLELHSSCPVCRYQLPSDESKINSRNNNNTISSNNEGDENRRGEHDTEETNENGSRFSVPLPWPFSLFSSSSPQSSGPSSNVPPSGSHAHDD